MKRKDDDKCSQRSEKKPRYDRRESREFKFPLLKHNNYTILNTARTNILMEIQDKDFVNQPGKQSGNLEHRDRRKYCRFQRDHGHDTENC